jgi:hypothetical protein
MVVALPIGLIVVSEPAYEARRSIFGSSPSKQRLIPSRSDNTPWAAHRSNDASQ